MSNAACRLLSGDSRSLTLRLSLPCLAAMFASGLSALLDALFLSRSGADAAAAAGLCFPLVTLTQTIGFTLGMGAGSFLSRCVGKDGEYGKPAAKAASAALYLSVFLGLFLAAAGQLFPRPLLHFLGARDHLLAPAALYARWLLASSPLTCASLVLASLLRAQGRTLPVMTAYLLGMLLGAALAFLLVIRLRLGLSGAGGALLAREALILACFLLYVRRRPDVHLPRLKDFSLRPAVLGDVMRSGAPTLVRQGLMSLSGVMLGRICAGMGTAAVAGMGLTQRAAHLVSSAVIGFGQGFAPVCGAAYGAGNMARIRKAYRFCMRVLVVSLLLLGAACFFAAPPLMRLFAPDEASALFAASALRAQCAVFFAQGAVILMNMLTQAMGLPVRAALTASSRQGYVLIPLLLILPRLFGTAGLLLAQPVSDMLSLLIGWALTRRILQTQEVQKNEPSPKERARKRI